MKTDGIQKKVNNGLKVFIRIIILIILLFICFRINQLVDHFIPHQKYKSVKEVVNHYLFWE